MDKLIKDWWTDTKKDAIEYLWFVSALVPIIYFIFSSPDRTEIIFKMIDSKDIFILTCMFLGVCILTFWLEKLIRFLLGTIWFLLTPIRLYISKRLN